MDFDTLVTDVLRREGGAKITEHKADRGGLTKFGISKRANPDVDVANLDEAGAKAIYRERYWDALGADALPNEVRALAFDTAVHHGVGRAKQWLEESGNDAAKLLGLRKAALQQQAAQPGQEVFAKGWMNRLAEFETPPAPNVRAQPDAAAVVAEAAAMSAAQRRAGVVAPESYSAVNAKEVAQEAVAAETGVLDVIGTAFYDPRSNALWSIAEHMQKPERDATFSYYDAPQREQWEKEVQSEAELQFLRENATSEDGAGWALNQLQQRREMDKTYGAAGAGANLAGQLAVGIADPVGWALGLGAGKIAQVAAVGARAGMAARIGLTVGESVAGNVAWEMLQDGIGEVKTAEDYGMAAAFGVGFSALGIPSAVRGARAAAVDVELGKLADAMTERAAVAHQDAKAQGLTPEQRGAKQAADIEQHVRASRDAAFDDDGAIVPADVAAAQRALDEAPGDVPPPPRREPAGVKAVEEATTPAAPDAAPSTAPSEATTEVPLPKELSGSKPKYRNAAVEFESDLEKALYIVASPSRKSKADEAFMVYLRGQFPGVSDADIRTEGGLVRAAVAELYTGEGSIRLAKAGEDFMAPKAGDADADTAARIARSTGERVTLRDAINKSLTQGSVKGTWVPFTLRHLLARMPDSILDGSFVERLPSGDRSFFNPEKNTTYFAADLNALKADESVVLLHEAVHAATVHVIRAVRNGVDGVTMQQKQAVQRLEEMRVRLKEYMEDEGMSTDPERGGAAYAVNSKVNTLEEFVSQVMSDVQTRELLSQIPGRGYQADTLMDAFIRAVLSALGYDLKRVVRGSALEDALLMTDTLIRTGGDIPTSKGVFFAPTPQQRALTDMAFADRMYSHARDWAGRFGVDPKRLEVLAQQLTRKGSTIRDYMVSDGLKMAASKNPIVQMMSGLLVETTTGAAGRRNTAAIHKSILNQRITGSAVNEYHTAYADYRKRNSGGHIEDHLSGKVKAAYDKAVYEEIIKRRYGQEQPATTDGAVKAGADALERLYQRSLDAQKEASTLGSGYLPPDSRGYVPQQFNADALAQATPQELDELAGHLTDHWVGAYGWSRDFSKQFSRLYIQRARQRATGATDGVDFVALENPSAAVRDTLEQMRLESRDLDSRARAELDRVGAMPQNKKRLDVDLLATLPGGKRVMDFYSTDVERMTRAHANSVAGHSALASRGVLGQRGVNSILRAIDNAGPDELASPDEVAALQRSFSEFLGTPVKGERRSEMASGLTALVRLQRLGGLAFTQLAETAQLVHHLGLSTALKALGSLPRQIMEVKKLKNLEEVTNPWLASIERHQGFDFGMQNFRMVARLDPPDELLREYGKGNSLATRLLQSGNFLQAQVSFFRGLHAAQHRATAEHILKRAVGYIEAGKSDVYLADMGIDAKLAQAIRGDLPQAIIRDAEGRAIGFDITQIKSSKARDQLLQSIHRGTAQIIQDTFIGERGAWAHDDWAKVLLQLRTFGLTAMEKQWGRTRVINSNGPMNGYGYAAGVLVGQMAFATMIYGARAQVYAAGREDREEFLERAFAPSSMVQSALNYSSMSGLAGDAVDILSAIGGGWNDDVRESLGTRSFATGVGGLIPVAGSIDAGLRLAQGKGDLHMALKQLPGSNLPWIAPILNLAKED